MAREKTKTITSIGGQALIEGIMMRGPKQTAVSVRMPDQTVSTEYMETQQLKDKHKWLGWPFIRGVVTFVESLSVGYKALSLSADKSGEDGEEELSKFDQWLQKTFGDNLMNAVMTVSSILGILLAIGLFFFLPTWIFNLFRDHVAGRGIEPWRSVLEGVMRILIFIGYIFLCSLMPDVRRVFQYHGAEHKTIFCYENQEELTVENVRRHSRFHPRCGTSFMVIMLLLGIIIGFFIPFGNPFVRTFVKLLCIPVIVGIGYELIRICGRHDNLATRIISAPGMWMQRLSTKEPADDMIEVAIASINAVIPENGEDQIHL